MNGTLLRRILLHAALASVWMAPQAMGIPLWSDPNTQRSGDLDVAGKWTSLVSHNPDDPILYPAADGLTELLRLRLGFKVHWSKEAETELAYEQSERWASTPASTSSSLLPADRTAPYRMSQLDWSIGHTERFQARHEIDRALATFHRPWGDVTLGRQAIGLGRGVIFSAVDVFAPFSPAEVDREWRRGVDGVRVERRLSDTSSVEGLGVFGQTWEQSAALGRVRGFSGQIDTEFLVGKRAQDTLMAGVLSATVGEAEVHAELAMFDTPDLHPDDQIGGGGHHAAMAVAGGSYTLQVGKGLTVLAECYYNGFGVRDTSTLSTRLADPAFQARVTRGDMLTVGQEALAAQLSYPFTGSITGALLAMGNPSDGSGVAIPSLTCEGGTRSRLIASAAVPWGRRPVGTQLQSEYGGVPLSLFVQWAMYW